MRSTEVQQALLGIDLCRKGDWADGLTRLVGAAASAERSNLPGIAFSYLGYGLALREGRIDEGLALCRHALRLQLFEPENHLNLARIQLLGNDRSAAYRTVREGLRVDRYDKELQALRRTLGERRRPLLSFLSRTHPINRLLGRLRHALVSLFQPAPAAARPPSRPNRPARLPRETPPAEPTGREPRPVRPGTPTGPTTRAPRSPAASRDRAS